MSDRMSTMNSGNLRLYALLISIALFAAAVPQQSSAADPVTRKFLTDERGDQRRYSRAVATEGGTIVWLAGQTTVQDADGKLIAGDFEAQADEVFRLIGENLAQIGGSLSDIVTMTIYVRDVRIGDSLLNIKEKYFGDGPYPSSALIGVVGFARQGVMIEIKAPAVIGQEVE